MMSVDVKRLSEAASIDTTRCEARGDAVRALRRMEAGLLAAASRDVAGVRRWFALRVAGVGEMALCQGLIDSRVDAVVPVKQAPVKRRIAAPARKLVHRPVLSGLVFVNIVPGDAAFAGLLRVDGVAALIGTAGRPHPIGDREMNGFMDLAQAGAFDERHAAAGLVVGSRVRIGVGAFAAFEGVLEGYARSRTARVRTVLFGAELTVDVKLAHLEKME